MNWMSAREKVSISSNVMMFQIMKEFHTREGFNIVAVTGSFLASNYAANSLDSKPCTAAIVMNRIHFFSLSHSNIIIIAINSIMQSKWDSYPLKNVKFDFSKRKEILFKVSCCLIICRAALYSIWKDIKLNLPSNLLIVWLSVFTQWDEWTWQSLWPQLIFKLCRANFFSIQ